MNVLSALSQTGIIPVVKLETPESTLPLADALSAGGLPAMEITFRTDCAAEAIMLVSRSRPDIVVGAGTVLTVEQAERAIYSGAQFIVSPGLNPKVVEYCLSKSIPVVPGCVTPTEIEAALSLGLDTVKFFPAEAFGGLKALKALSAPYSGVRFMPTGGISLDNAAEYLAFSKVFACGGSFMVTDSLIKSGSFDKIAALSLKAAELVKASGRK